MMVFASVTRDLAINNADGDPREFISERVLELMRCDTLASYIWRPEENAYKQAVTINQDNDRVREYIEHLQYCDPLTSKMRTFRGAAVVEQVFPMKELSHTDFYQDFLRPEGMYHGINIFVETAKGEEFDLRLWRHKSRPAFEQRDIDLLNTLADCMLPAMLERLARHDTLHKLSDREREISHLVAKGCSDKDISTLLGISFSTVRTHVNRCFAKLECANRAELSARFTATRID
jgi:DNA-binding CsgD family transcriptional regulator